MPVEFAEYDPQPTDLRWVRDPDSNPHRIVSFLAENPGVGFTPKEIAEATEVARGSVGTTLSRLEEQGLVRHKEPYWAIVDDGRLAGFEAMLTSLRTEVDRSDNWSGIDEGEFASNAEMAAWRRRQDDGDE